MAILFPPRPDGVDWQQRDLPPASDESHIPGQPGTLKTLAQDEGLDMKVRLGKAVFTTTALALMVFAVCVTSSMGQTTSNRSNNGAGGGSGIADPDKIIQAFTAKEAEFRRALNNYSFKRDALIQSLGMGGQVIGEYHRVSNFTFDDSGNRFEKITFFPMPSMPEVTPEDIEDLGGIEPFALEPAKIPRYNIRYVGKEKIDELNLYIFDVEPKVIPDPKKSKERLFVGRVWVDDQDLQIVKTKGKGVPETKQNKFPTVETYREHIDGRYWFPTYSYADEELVYENGSTLHVRMKVRYMDFTPARATLKVTEIGENETPSGSGKPVEVGALNAKATSLPKPAYTEEMKRIKARGRVTVRVVVDENGKVTSAQAVDGPVPLREAAEAAARQATFNPITEGGIVVKATGVLTYDFP
jgi:TonB family protein